MRTITLRIEPSPTSNDHQVRIQIDGHDWLGENYLGIDPPRFFSQSTLTTGGSAIVGRCECGTMGCDDRIADIVIESDEVTWNINKEYTLHFDKAAYLAQSPQLYKHWSLCQTNRVQRCRYWSRTYILP